jgi:SAM-dependent methyltransferase
VGLHAEGLDINDHACRFARRRGFRVTVGDLDSWSDDRVFDAVAIWNCFDQLPDPRRAARGARARLAPGGVLALRVPNGGFYAALRRRSRGVLGSASTALLAHNNLLSFPYRHGFTVGSMTHLLASLDFEIVRVVGDSLVPTADRFTRRWAMVEERVAKGIVRVIAKVGGAERAPWFEVYARVRR